MGDQYKISRRTARWRVAPPALAAGCYSSPTVPCARKFLNPFRQRADSSPAALRFPNEWAATRRSEYGLLVFECRLKTPDSITNTAGPTLLAAICYHSEPRVARVECQLTFPLLTCPFLGLRDHLDVQLGELRRVDRGGSVGHQIDGVGVLREGD